MDERELEICSIIGPRVLDPQDSGDYETSGEEDPEAFIEGKLLEDLLDIFKCPICLEVYEKPCRVKDCGHMFCKECGEKYARLFKPSHCALCRNNIQTRRDFRLDLKMSLISKN